MSQFRPYLTRLEIDSDRESDGLLLLSGRGRAGEAPRDILWMQQHGLASRPPQGAVGAFLALGGAHAQPLAVGGEHPGLRPRMEAGETVIYNAHGQAVSIVKNNIRIVGGDSVHIKATTIILDGECRLGGEDASRPASAEGTVDSDGDVDTGNLATRVYVK
ncbi:phage baseplate assembly protein domain-containing protein [Afifella aestuarii]|uniref:phage baseplate assembly protein domain-containing protein n=1 Tax=Afifella aestuarii TaxID=1909496 RepID=UPI000FE2E260|nr:phage baseplate assembly protein [Afifella aestuarii]